jgi:hypothetical protein
MWNRGRTQGIVIACLIGTGLIQLVSSSHGWATAGWFILGWVAFGILNAIITASGTQWLRYVSIAASFLMLLFFNRLPNFAILIWLIWPPAILVAAAIGQRIHSGSDGRLFTPAKSTLAHTALSAIIASVAVVSLLYRLLVLDNLQQTAALFVGIPALLAILVVSAVSPRSAVGVACKAVTIGLLVSLMFLGEGILCIAMSAPLFYAVAILIGLAVKFAQRDHGGLNSNHFFAVVPSDEP